MPPKWKNTKRAEKKSTPAKTLRKGSTFGKMFMSQEEPKKKAAAPLATPRAKRGKATPVFAADSPDTPKTRSFEDVATSVVRPTPKKRSGLKLENKKQKQHRQDETDVSSMTLEFSPMRKSSEKGRRTSLGKRGKRVSSIGNGFVAVPHDDVPIEDFYKHFDESLPEPHKMRQLLTWNAKRVLRRQSTQDVDSEMVDAWQIASQIKDMIIRDLEEGNIQTSWLNRNKEEEKKVEDTMRPIKVKPNEVNVTNKKNVELLEAKLRQLRAEEKQWQKSLAHTTEQLTQFKDDRDLAARVKEVSLPFEVEKVVDGSVVAEQARIVDQMDSKTSDLLSSSIDKFASLTQRLNAVTSSVNEFAESETTKLEEILQSHFNKRLPVKSLLRGISRVPS